MDNHEDILDRFYQLFDSIYKVMNARSAPVTCRP